MHAADPKINDIKASSKSEENNKETGQQKHRSVERGVVLTLSFIFWEILSPTSIHKQSL